MPDVPKTSTRKPAKKPLVKKLLPLLEVEPAARNPVGCLTCGLCCTYIAVAIDGPISAKAATEILWHLYHDGVSIYRDGDDEWMVQFESRCRHLLDDNKCGIYEQRPHICRDYSEVSCEVNSEGTGTTFYAPSEFLTYLEKNHRRIFRKISLTHVPPPAVLGRRVLARKKHEPFEKQFNRLRALGEPGDKV
jgi:Fe-S-cluster containining protein